MFAEFKKFVVRGNVLDLAVGVVIGTAFGKIVSSFVADIIMPPIGLLLGGVDFSHLVIILKQTTETSAEVTLNYGLFINSIIDFLIISFAIFIVIRQVNRFQKKQEETPAPVGEDILLLREIRDSLKAGK
ncbi:MAG TPA: large-conductance mechanosensitive channel protein MscL [bacterium]|nr:large-conductance mechanosensitive channel protein MscL [bacterium]